jgi:hypothetical protein
MRRLAAAAMQQNRSLLRNANISLQKRRHPWPG